MNEDVEGLAAPFAILKGVDELAGVLTDPAGVYRALRILGEAVHPVGIRFAVTWGEIDVGAGGDDVAAMDGPAFHRADALLTEVADEDRTVGLAFPPADDLVVDLLAALLEMVLCRKRGWTERQTELVGLYRKRGTAAAVAEAEEITPQSVSRTLGRADARAVLSTERQMSRAFESIARDCQ